MQELCINSVKSWQIREESLNKACIRYLLDYFMDFLFLLKAEKQVCCTLPIPLIRKSFIAHPRIPDQKCVGHRTSAYPSASHWTASSSVRQIVQLSTSISTAAIKGFPVINISLTVGSRNFGKDNRPSGYFYFSAITQQ